LLSLHEVNQHIASKHTPMEDQRKDIEDRIFNIEDSKFTSLAAEIYRLQLKEVPDFSRWCEINEQFQQSPSIDSSLETGVPLFPLNFSPTFLPIQFFKSRNLIPNCAQEQKDKLLLFESSGTTQQQTSKHWVVNPSLYTQSFVKTFENRFGDIDSTCIIGLLPSYLERQNSSLVYMVDFLIHQSNQPNSGFYLYEYESLWTVILENEKKQIPTVVFGVTFALLELAAWVNERWRSPEFASKPSLKYIQWVETGGMKGKGKELTRAELHIILKDAFNVPSIESEYGMTELLSQAYTRPSDGKFVCPPWMKVLVYDPMDPKALLGYGKTGRLCIIDLANVYSCSFIATDDLGKYYEDGSFEVIGRIDFSDLRGCNQLV